MAAVAIETITNAAYRKCGLLLPDTDEDAYALEAFNNMIGIWSTKFVIPVVTRESFDLVAGQAEYTIGESNGVAYDFDTVRPIRLLNVYLKDSDNYSYSVGLMSPQDYNRIGSKTLEGRPVGVYFIPEYPGAKIIFNKEADKVYTAYFEFMKHFTEVAALGTVYLPDEYKEALVYNLAVRLAEDNSVQLSSTVIQKARETYFTLAYLSSANRIPPKARFDFGGSGTYNIEIDE